MSRSVVHVVLSLLLLASQQMSLLHGFVHLGEGRLSSNARSFAQLDEEQVRGKKAAKAAVHHICGQCAAAAQLAFALPAMAYLFVPPALPSFILDAQSVVDALVLTTSAFQPRAPPQAI
jgi:Na+-transporting methylmalonyl-CoA/oxaloacetate decarboxylase gamma subunit